MSEVEFEVPSLKTHYYRTMIIKETIGANTLQDLPAYVIQTSQDFKFALNLLIPTRTLNEAINTLGGLNQVFEQKELREKLASEFNVDDSMMILRLSQLLLKNLRTSADFKPILIDAIAEKIVNSIDYTLEDILTASKLTGSSLGYSRCITK